jgi:alginate O-acetyltransferase complex protein AlgI
MVFSTTIFLFLFLPLFLAVYYALPLRLRNAWVLLASWAFYGWWRVDFLGLLVLTSLWTYGFGRAIARRSSADLSIPADPQPGRAQARRALAAGVILNLGVLGYFKYFNFGVESLNALLGAGFLTAWKVVLPIGISFYVFQAISYLVDVYRGDAPPAESFLDFAAYIALFPQLIAGPILRYKDLAAQLRGRRHTVDLFSEGAVRFMIGFCKKVLIADTVAPLAAAAFGLARPSFADAWLGALAYTVQIYFDFSGYSDMAIGLGRMIGFRFMENFNMPYISKSITEFWRRWHISLSTWLRDYLYIPLGGNRRGTRRTYLNLMLVMLLGGLWHGAAWTFVLWGLWHGLLLAAERRFAARPGLRRLDGGGPDRPGADPARGPLAVASTMLLVVAGWVMFRSPDVGHAAAMYAGMIGLHGLAASDALSWQLSRAAVAALAIGLALIYLAPLASRRRRRASLPLPAAQPYAAGLAVVPLFLLGIVKLSAESFSPFLYFKF